MVPGLVRASTLNPQMKQPQQQQQQHYYDESTHRYYKRPSSHKRTKQQKRTISDRYSFGTQETYQSNPTTQYSVDSDDDENDYYEQQEQQTLDDIIDDFWNAIDSNKHNIHHRESFIVKKLKRKQPMNTKRKL